MNFAVKRTKQLKAVSGQIMDLHRTCPSLAIDLKKKQSERLKLQGHDHTAYTKCLKCYPKSA